MYLCLVQQTDYIIVGLGLAGLAACEWLERLGKSFVVFDPDQEAASKVAAGLYNPVILKRYTMPWKAIEQFDLALDFYGVLEKKLDTSILQQTPLQKIFSSIEDQNNWFTASDKAGLDRFVKAKLTKNENQRVQAPFELGEVKETGRIDIKRLLRVYGAYLKTKNYLIEERFDYQQLEVSQKGVTYQEHNASRILFAEGFGLKKNPYFSTLPLVGNKGEYLIIKAPELQITTVLKSSFFVVPLGDDHYKVGATFNWEDKDWNTTEAARNELLLKLRKLIDCDFEIVDQEAGMRPTTGDRRALIGVHPQHPQLALLNGLGTRGIMAGPFLAKQLVDHLEEGKVLLPEIDIKRFGKRSRALKN